MTAQLMYFIFKSISIEQNNQYFNIKKVNSADDLQNELPIEKEYKKNIYCIISVFSRGNQHILLNIDQYLKNKLLFNFFLSCILYEIEMIKKQDNFSDVIYYSLKYNVSQLTTSDIKNIIDKHLFFIVFDCIYNENLQYISDFSLNYLPSMAAYPFNDIIKQEEKYIFYNTNTLEEYFDNFYMLAELLSRFAKYFVHIYLNIYTNI